MAIKNPNGYGCIKKLSGKRRRPYAVVVTIKYDSGAKDISFLEKALGKELYTEVRDKYEKYMEENSEIRQVRKYLGYYETRQEAMIALADYNKSPYDIDKRNTTFGEIYEILYEEKFSKMKKQAKSSYVSSMPKCESIKNIRMTELKKNHMQRIMEEYSHLSKSTQSNILGLFHAVYKFALENDIVEKDYSQFVTATSDQQSKQKVPFSREEVNLLWDNLDTYKFTDSILVMIYTGVRVGELFAIKKEDVHLEERYITLKGTKTKAADRLIPIHKKIAPLLEKRLTGDSEWLFPSAKGTAIGYTAFREDNFDVIMNGLGFTHTPHECRHSFATYAASSGIPKIYRKKIMGHSSQDLTDDVYTHTFIEDLIKEIDKYEI
jgi:integrase